MMMDSVDIEDGFVSVDLDSSHCDICRLDTGEDLVACGICRQEIANAGSNRIGFNELPPHAHMQAHKGCLWKEHQIRQNNVQFSPVHSPICSTPTVSPARSPSSGNLFDLMTGGSGGSSPSRFRSVSTPVTPKNKQSPVSKHRRFTVIGGPVPEDNLNQKSKSYDELSKDSFNTKLQKLLRKAKNKELIENKRNDTGLTVQSSPNTRCSSPMLINNEGSSIHKSRSDKNLNSSVQKEADPKYVALKQSYAKYLFGKSIFSKPRDIFGGRRKQSPPAQVKTPTPAPPNTTVVDYPVYKPEAQKPKNTEFEVRLHPIDADKQRTSPKSAGDKKKSSIVGRRDVKPDVRTNQQNNNNGKYKGRSKSVPVGVLSSQFQDVRSGRSRQSTPTVLVINEESREKEDLFKLSSNHLRDKIHAMSSIVKDISNDLVNLLEERDDLRHEVKMRHLMIEKLVHQDKAMRMAHNS